MTFDRFSVILEMILHVFYRRTNDQLKFKHYFSKCLLFKINYSDLNDVSDLSDVFTNDIGIMPISKK